jgi:DNA modification methylase
MISSTCDDNSVVLDIFGGAGTTAIVALQLGHRAISIDLNPDYTREARERLGSAPASFAMNDDDQTDGGSVVTLSSQSVQVSDSALAAD